MTFDQFSIDPRCLRILEKQGITEPTLVQAEAIPVAFEGGDVLAVAQTSGPRGGCALLRVEPAA